MKKAIIYLTIIVLIGLVGYIIYQMANFSLFDVEIKKVAEIKVPNKPYTLNLYYIAGNATAQNVIQVRQQLNDTETVLQNYEKFNFVNSYEIPNDTTLQLVLSDTTFIDGYAGGKADTILLKIQ